jgi:hypothetical protein
MGEGGGEVKKINTVDEAIRAIRAAQIEYGIATDCN